MTSDVSVFGERQWATGKTTVHGQETWRHHLREALKDDPVAIVPVGSAE